MRISRLAREYDLSIQTLTSYLETLEPALKSVHPNAKLEEETIAQVLAHFDISIEENVADESPVALEPMQDEVAAADDVKPTPIEAPAEDVKDEPEEAIPATPEEEIALLDGDLELLPERDVKAPEEEPEEAEEDLPISEEETILSDQLIELIEAEEQPQDLEKIKLIKAPKKKLSGLKVLDKIEILPG